jgi:hypothetical protein
MAILTIETLLGVKLWKKRCNFKPLVAERLALGGAISVSSLVPRFPREGGTDTPAFRHVMTASKRRLHF